MIPMELRLRNFLSYREEEVVDLRDIHVACISGRNGAGKSSILEGMIWALFGKSRAPTEEDLVNRTARLMGEHMEVRLVFALGESTYRILRRRRKSDSVLEFALADGEGEWISLTEGGKRETQAAIEDTLRMGYETFVNASFLQQGQADAFTTQTPARRKEILADVLGVQVWEAHRARFAERRKGVETSLLLLRGRMEDNAEELAQREEREAALQAALQAQAEVDALLTAQTTLRDQAQRTAELRRSLLARQQTLTEQIRRLEAQQQETIIRRDQMAAEQARDEALLAESDETDARYQQWRAAEQARRRWEELYRDVTRLREAQAAAEREIAAAAGALAQQIAALEVTEAKLAQQVGEEAALRQERAAQAEALAAAEARLVGFQEAESGLREAERALQQLESQRQSVARDLQRAEAAAGQAAKQQQELTRLAARREVLAAEVTRLEAAQTARQQQLQRRNELQGTIQVLQQTQPRLKEEMDSLKERLDRLQAEQGGSCPLCGQALTADHRATVIADLQQQGKKRGDAFRANRQQLAEHEEERQRLEAVLAEGARGEAQLTEARRSVTTLEARMGELNRLQATWDAEGAPELAALRARLAELQPGLAQLGQDVVAQKQALAGRDAAEQEAGRLRQALTRSEARLEQMAQEAAAWAAEGKDRLAALRQQRESEAFAGEARARSAELAGQIEALGYDGAAHEAARREATELADAEARYNRLQEARTAVTQRRETLALYATRLAEQAENLASARGQLKEVDDTLAGLGDGDADLPALEAQVAELRRQVVEANQKVGHARSKFDMLTLLAEREKELLAEQEQLQRHLGRLQLLEKACSRDGVQALLIDHALPSIEDRANDLLERLTGGEMSISFQTQKAMKTRDAMRETLEIRIVDRAGERPYENYSGGEQFRVNFAIRLALSQALAHRSGAALATLVIDEGFGSQDPQGRDRLVEAINEIQDEFARILVITHVEELKDAFPTRIEVEKRPGGSVVNVIR